MPAAEITHNEPALDSGKLMRMRSYLDTASFREVIAEFETGIRQRLLNLEALDLTPSQIDAICHDLINFSGTLGLCELASAAEQLREHARRQARADLVSAQVAMRPVGDRAVATLQNYMEALLDE
ncbi:hypothetical protein [Hyphomicrobium sp.]|uniref:hypothetical protein n=1 Tax=Hyphomicrobium sp. TaxID=82 RepID=UPI002D774398|nr:hypothetical protein [Hyphomicrobium sp.]HET6389250.1 hypothetical protein [Hyphomicrobium sp.]